MGNVTNAPVPFGEEAPESVAEGVKIFLLPSWVYSAFTSKFSLNEIHTYSKLRQVLGLEDVAHLEVVRKEVLKALFTAESDAYSVYAESFLCPHSNELTEDERKEVQVSVDLMVKTPSVVKEALDRLRLLPDSGALCEAADRATSIEESQAQSETKLPCRIVVMNQSLYILVEEGFLSSLEGGKHRLIFLTQVLKAAYAIFPIRVVNRSVWYPLYIRALAA